MNLPDPDVDDIKIKALYHFNQRDYASCLNTILCNYSVMDINYKTLGLCCLLLNDSPQDSYYSELYNKLKNEKLFDLLDAYNFFAFESKYYGSFAVIENFCSILISSTNQKCIKYVRKALEKVPGLSCFRLAFTAYENGLFYLCDEILNLHCSDKKNDYSLILLRAKVLLRLNNLAESQKYISYARTLKDSNELYKLACLCKIMECIDIVKSRPADVKSDLVESILKYLEDAKDCLLKNKEGDS